MKRLRWLIVFVAAAIVKYLLPSTPRWRANRNTQRSAETDRAVSAFVIASMDTARRPRDGRSPTRR
jgi:hypothetical protein